MQLAAGLADFEVFLHDFLDLFLQGLFLRRVRRYCCDNSIV